MIRDEDDPVQAKYHALLTFAERWSGRLGWITLILFALMLAAAHFGSAAAVPLLVAMLLFGIPTLLLMLAERFVAVLEILRFVLSWLTRQERR
jgi:hypothetical protein